MRKFFFFFSIQILFLTAFIAFAQAGGPAAYSIAALSGDHAYVGSSQEHTVKVRIILYIIYWSFCEINCRFEIEIHIYWHIYESFHFISFFFCISLHRQGLYGQNVVSSYAKAVDSAHSSVRVTSSRQSNDIIGEINVWFLWNVFRLYKFQHKSNSHLKQKESDFNTWKKKDKFFSKRKKKQKI